MPDFPGFAEAAAAVIRRSDQVPGEGSRTRGIGGPAGTAEVRTAIAELVPLGGAPRLRPKPEEAEIARRNLTTQDEA